VAARPPAKATAGRGAESQAGGKRRGRPPAKRCRSPQRLRQGGPARRDQVK